MSQLTAVQAEAREPSGSADLDVLVEECCGDSAPVTRGPSGRRLQLPAEDVVIEAVEAIRAAMFPGHAGCFDLAEERLRYQVGAALARILPELERQLRRAQAYAAGHDGDACPHCLRAAQDAHAAFLGALP